MISICGAVAFAACGMSAAAELLAQAYYDAMYAETVQDGNATNEYIQNDD